MAKPHETHSEYNRRQHLVLGAYLAMHCWHGGYDAVIVDRFTLSRLHELEKFKDERLSWLRRDIRPYFLYSEVLHFTNKNKFGALVLSRTEIPEEFLSGNMRDEARAKRGRENDYRVCALSELKTCDTKITEESAVSFLALAANGLTFPAPLKAATPPPAKKRPFIPKKLPRHPNS